MTAIAPPSRKTLLEWIDTDASDPSDDGRPVCPPKVAALHHAIGAGLSRGEAPEPFVPPRGLALAPIG